MATTDRSYNRAEGRALTSPTRSFGPPSPPPPPAHGPHEHHPHPPHVHGHGHIHPRPLATSPAGPDEHAARQRRRHSA